LPTSRGEAVSERYEAKTLRAVAAWHDAEAAKPDCEDHPCSLGRFHFECARRLDALALEAEAREPDLADWVRAAMSSKLGPLTMSATDDGEWILFWGPDNFAAALEGTFVHIAHYGEDAEEIGVTLGYSNERITDPAELHAALNAIADVKP
jgi:hypothetical protein